MMLTLGYGGVKRRRTEVKEEIREEEEIKANDEEARAWISRKQVIAWGIINELSVEIERLESITVGDSEELNGLKMTLERTKQEHEIILKKKIDYFKNEIDTIQNNASEELE